MNRTPREIVVAALAAGGPGATFDPLQLQVLLFLIDRTVPDRIGGPFFGFRPGPLGPIDDLIYQLVEEMATAGDAVIDRSEPTTLFRLTDAGHTKGEAVLATLEPSVADYFGRVARWTLLVPHRPMLRSVFHAYPEMATKCVVPDWAKKAPKRQATEYGLHPFAEGFVRAFDFFGFMRRPQPPKPKPKSDGEAIRKVWRDVGGFLEDAMVKVGKSEGLW